MVFYAVALLYAVITLGPFIWSVLTSFKPTSEMLYVGIDFNKLTVENYLYIFNSFPFLTWLLNSVIVSVSITALNLLINSLTGYALARIRFPGRDALFILVIALMMIPMQVTLVPTYMLINSLSWVNTFPGLIIPFSYTFFGIFLMRQFFLSMPKALEEAAMIDGMNRFGIFFKIALPLAKEVLSAQLILTFIGKWNDLLWPSLIASSEDKYTLPVGLNSFYGQYYQFWNQVLAGVMILTLPSLIIFLTFQKNFVQGIATAGIKD